MTVESNPTYLESSIKGMKFQVFTLRKSNVDFTYLLLPVFITTLCFK